MFRVVLSKEPIPRDKSERWPLQVMIPHYGDEQDRDLARGQLIEVVAGGEVRVYRITHNHRLKRPTLLARREAIAVPAGMANG